MEEKKEEIKTVIREDFNNKERGRKNKGRE